MSVDELLTRAAAAAERRFVSTARGLFEEALEQYPKHRGIVEFQLGAFHFDVAGDGALARQHFAAAIAHLSASTPIEGAPSREAIEAYACENSMLLSLSYEEYESWATRLEKLAPSEAILQVQRPDVADKRDRGVPWADVLAEWCFTAYSHPDRELDRGAYGRAAATLRLCLQNRKMLRLDRERWRSLASGYEGALLSLIVQYLHVMKAEQNEDPAEIHFIIEEAAPLVEEFVQAHPGDQTIETSLQALRRFLNDNPMPPRVAPRSYVNQDYGFSIEFPDSWTVEDSRGFFDRVLGNKRPPRFRGPRQSMTFDVSPGDPTTAPAVVDAGFRRAAPKAGYRILTTGSLGVGGRDHFCMVYEAMNSFGLPGVIFKKYCLIFERQEFTFDCEIGAGDPSLRNELIRNENLYDSVLGTFKRISHTSI